MKTNFKKAIMPLTLVVLGAAAAFATNAIKENERARAPMVGYYYDVEEPVGNRCKPVETDCSDFGNYICTEKDFGEIWKHSTETLTGCTELLYRNQPNN